MFHMHNLVEKSESASDLEGELDRSTAVVFGSLIWLPFRFFWYFPAVSRDSLSLFTRWTIPVPSSIGSCARKSASEVFKLCLCPAISLLHRSTSFLFHTHDVSAHFLSLMSN